MNNKNFVSIVIPSLNEEKNIRNVLTNCLKAIEKNKLKAEIILMDSSTDKTPDIAKKLGAKVYKTAKKGLGYAYIKSLRYIKGNYVVMGDADGTYDFLELDRFVKKLDNGYDFVMGTRLKGDIKQGAMPWSHRYIGTPILTFFINLLFKTKISDCNSGLRALTKSAFQQMQLESYGWEYASEMIVKASLLNLKITEVPVTLHPDRFGRKSHLNPFSAGWDNLRYIFLLSSEFIFLKIGFIIWIIGFILVATQVRGTFTLFNLFIGLHSLIFGLILSFLGFFVIQMGLLTQMFSYLNAFRITAISRFVKKWFSFEKGLVIGGLFFGGGVFLELLVLINRLFYYTKTFNYFYLALFGMYFIINGIMIIYFAFIFSLFKRHK